MPQKVDKRLQEAVQKGFEKRTKAQRKTADEAQAKLEAHQNELKRQLPKARAWVKDKLFEEIAKEEARGSRTLVLDDYVDGISTEVIFNLVRKIDGLDISCREATLWEDSDYGKITGLRYYITWKSADPNLNRDY